MPTLLSDGNHTSAAASTINGLGPRGSRAHSAEECIEGATLLERTKMIALFLDPWAAEVAVGEDPYGKRLRRPANSRGR